MAKRKKRKKGKVVSLQPKLSPKKYIMKIGRKLPLHEVLITADYQEKSLATVLVSRIKKNGDIINGIYLIDPLCLGLINTTYHIVDEDQFQICQEMINKENGIGLIAVDPNFVFNYIYGAIEFAEDCGFEPHKDFSVSQFILDDVESLEYADIEFGREGKPLYIAHNSENYEKNLNILDRTVGHGNYEFILQSDFNDSSVFEDEDKYDALQELIHSILPLKQDQDDYQVYFDIVNVIQFFFGQNMHKLKYEYVTNPSALLEDIRQRLDEYEEIDLSEDPIDADIFLPIIENYIIHDGPEFIESEYIIGSFNSDRTSVYHLENTILKYLLLTYGQNKFEKLYTIIEPFGKEDDMLYDIDSLKENIMDYKERFLESINEHISNQHISNQHGLPFFESIIFRYISYYELAFGVIPLEAIRIDLSEILDEYNS